MKFAFLIMGNFDSRIDNTAFRNASAQMIGFADICEACAVARKLYEEGIGCIELCGAFGPDGARRIIEATENKIPIGYVTHLPEQDKVYQEVFQGKKTDL